MSFTQFLGVVVSRWRIVAACVVLALLAALAATYLTTPVYSASARIYLSAEPASGQEGDGSFVLSSEDIETYRSILNTPAVLDPVREELGLPEGRPIDVEAIPTTSTTILDITARSTDPEEAAAVANEIGPQIAAVAGKFSTLLAASGHRVVSTPIQPATAPGSPISPNLRMNLALALLAGLAVGVGVALFRHALDTKVRTEDDLKMVSDAPLLASLPVARTGSGEALISVDDDPHGGHAEAIRRLRTNLLFVDITTGKHSFVITSAMPGEGKTTTAVNLALAMADAGTRTLLVDADLRSPSVAKTLGIDGEVGLTTILLGQATTDEVIQRWGPNGLDVLPAGPVPPNPSELLGSTPMETLFAQLQRDYDFVVLDSPPVVPVVDAIIVQRLAGGLLMVVAHDRTKKRDLASALKQLATVGANVSGFAQNYVHGREGRAYRYGETKFDESVAPPGQASVTPPGQGADER